MIENYKVGDILSFRCEISDLSRFEPILEEFIIKVIDPLKKQTTKSGERKPPASNKDGSNSQRPDGFAIPVIIEVSKDGRTGHSWEEQDFNEVSSLRVKGSDHDGYDFFVNIDNIHLLTELKAANNSEIKALEAKYKFGIVLIGIALLQNSRQVTQEDHEEDILEIVKRTSQAVSPVIIPMIDSLGAIKIEDIIALPEEV
jgi:hypothetical protein